MDETNCNYAALILRVFVYIQVVYHLQEIDGDNDMFSISTVGGKGVVRLLGNLDYERKFLYQIRVLAVDRANNDKVWMLLKQ